MSVYVLSIYTPSVHVRIKLTANIHIDLTYVCVYFGRVFTRSSPVCVYMFPGIHAEVHTELVCVCVYGYVYTQRVYMWACLRLCVYLYTHGVYKCVYIFTYICMCVQLRIYTQILYVCVYRFTYMKFPAQND